MINIPPKINPETFVKANTEKQTYSITKHLVILKPTAGTIVMKN